MASKIISPAIRAAIVADKASGLTCAQIGAKFGLHRVSVQRIVSRLKKAVPSVEIAATDADYKMRIKQKAVRSVERALDDNSDSYKSGSIGVSVLKGLGEFESGPGGGVILHLITPKDWIERYREPIPVDVKAEVAEDEDAQDAEKE